MNKYTDFAALTRAGFNALFFAASTFGVHTLQAATPVGVTLLVQPWDPVNDDDSVKTIYNNNDLITKSITRTWDQFKKPIIDSFKATLQTPNLLAKGVSLYDVNLNINTPELTILSDGKSGFVAKLLVRDTYLEATSTTPDIPLLGFGLGSYADPKCSIRFSLEVTLKMAASEDRSRLLEARYAPGDAPLLIRDFKADSQNAPCDIAKFLASDVARLFAGKDFWKWMTDEVNNPKRREYKQLNDAIKHELDSAVSSINAHVRAQVPAEYAKYARIRLWAGKDKLTVLLGVRELPLPARVASAGGRLKIGDLKGLALPINSCDQLRMAAMVKTGPRPVLDPIGTLGAAPMIAVGKLRGSALAAPATGQACDYAVDQLVPGFPNLLTFTVSQETMTRNRTSSAVYVMYVHPEGWKYDKALHPQPSIGNLNLTLFVSDVGAGGLRQQYERTGAVRQDPLTDAAGSLGRDVLNTRPQSGTLINQGSTVSPAVSAPRMPGSIGVKSPLSATPLSPATSALSGSGAALLVPATPLAPTVQAPVNSRTQLKNGDAAGLNVRVPLELTNAAQR